MKSPVTMSQAQVYGISKQNSKEIFQFFQKNFGCTRKVYNMCVDSCYKQLEQAGYTSGDDLPDISFPKVAALKKDYPYLKEADGLGLANSVLDFQKACKTFRDQKDRSTYRKSALRRDRSGKELLSFRGLKGIPRFHAKLAGYFSYRTACQYPKEGNALKRPTIRLEGSILYLPKLKQGVKLIIHRKLPEDAHILNVTVFMDTDGTYRVSICYSYTFLMEMDYREAATQEQPLPKETRFLGLDYSQKDLYVDSEGRKMYDENRKFTKLVMFMAEKYYSNNLVLNEAVSTFEDVVETSGNGEASFGVAGEDWERIEFTAPPYKHSDARFYAEYYNGFQAPFLVCIWNKDYAELEDLLKNTSEKLYKAYRKEMEWDMTYERLDKNLLSVAKGLGEFYLNGTR